MLLRKIAAARHHLAAASMSTSLAAAALYVAGCGTAEDPSSVTVGSNGPVGSAELALVLQSGSSIDKVEYAIKRRSKKIMDGTVPVSKSNEVKFQIGAIPAGDEYGMWLWAKTSNGVECTGGPAEFEIVAGRTSLLAMTLRCGDGDSEARKGSVKVDVDVISSGNGCAEVDGVTVVPSSVEVGASMSMRGYASGTATYAWTVTPANAGTFSDADDNETDFVCGTAGRHKVTFSVMGKDGCTANTSDVEVYCTGEGGSTGGSGGATGGAGGATGGAGGATGGAGGETGGAGGATGGAGGATGGAGGATGGAGGATGGAGGATGGAGGATGGAGGATGGAGGATGGAGGATGGAGGATGGAGGAGGATGGAGGATGGAGGATGGAGGSPGGAAPDGTSAACATCRTTNCSNYEGLGINLVTGCFTAIDPVAGASATDPAFLQDCIDLMVCAKTNKCAGGAQGLGECYCGGTTPDLCIMNGPAADAKCVPQFKKAVRAESNDLILERMSLFEHPAGWAYFLADCDRKLCATDCVPQ